LIFDILAVDRASDQVQGVRKAFELLSVEAAVAKTSFDKLDAQFRQTDVALRMTDAQIEKTKREIRELALVAATTGDIDVFKQLRAKRGELGAITAVHKELTGVKAELETKAVEFGRFFAKTGEDAGVKFVGTAGSGMLGALGVLPGEVKAGLIGAVTIAAAVAAPLLGAAIGGAVLTGIGGAGIAAGIVGVIGDPRIRQAGTALGGALAADFHQATASFIGPTLEGIVVIGDALHGLKPDLKGIFGPLSGEVLGLAHGIAGLAANTMPGLREAVAASLPVIETLSRELPQIGKAFSDMFRSIASGSDGAQQGMQVLFDLTETMIRNLGTSIGFLENAWSHLVGIFAATGHGMESVIGWVPVLGGHLKSVTGYYDHLKKSLGDNKSAALAAGAVGSVSTAVGELGGTALGAVTQMQNLRAELDRLQKANFDARDTERALEAAIDDGTKAFKTNGRTLNDHTAEGRANSAALDAIASSANAAAEGVLQQTGSQERANTVLQHGRDAFIKLAQSMGASTVEAKRLANMLFTIPSPKPTVSVQIGAALAAIARVQQNLKNLHDKDLHIGVYYTSSGNLKLPGGTQVQNLRGGVYEHAASGLLRDAAIYGAQSPARYAFAEPATGGEAFIPKHGDAARSMAILDRAESWYGRVAMPAGSTASSRPVALAGGGGRQAVQVYVTVQGGRGDPLMEHVLRNLRYVVRVEGGGDVQTALGSSF
jgi:hypothetical protein